MARKAKPKDEGNEVPAWIVSFSDMVTLLLAFFVLLQSFASVQDPELFFVGQGSFKRAIAGMGIPSWLYGRQDSAKREFINVKHPTDESEEKQPPKRIINADADKIKHVFDDLQKQMETAAADLSQRPIRVEPTPIRFRGSAAELDEAARAWLRQFAFDIRQTLQDDQVKFFVIGLAPDQRDIGRQWTISAVRARAVEQFLAPLLSDGSSQRRWSTYSWGAGAGGAWCKKRGFLPEKTDVVIAVVREKSDNG